MHLWGVGVFYVGIFFLLLPYNNFKYMLDRSRYHHQQPHCVGPLLPSRGGRRKNRTQEEDGGAAGLRAADCEDNATMLRQAAKVNVSLVSCLFDLVSLLLLLLLSSKSGLFTAEC